MSQTQDLYGAGEYGATKVALTKDGSAVRFAFGRNGDAGPVYFGAVILSAEAAAELKQQLTNLGL